jgi:hypothetical protein
MDPMKLTCEASMADKVLAKNLATLTGYLDLILSAILYVPPFRSFFSNS